MRAARVTGPKRFEILDVDKPAPRDGQCLIELERWSICGTDIRYGYGPSQADEQFPGQLGGVCHEIAGTVVESRAGEFEDGQRVIVIPSFDGPGGLVEYIVAEPGHMAGVPNEGDLTDWVMCQPAGTVVYACKRVGTFLGKRVLVLGQGGIGLSFSAMCSRLGASQVIACDVLDYRLERARRLGASHVINPTREKLDDAVSEITEGHMPDITIEAAGYPDTLNDAFRLVKKFGTVVMFGIQEGSKESEGATLVNTSYLIRNEPTVIPCGASGSGDPVGHVREMVGLKARGWWDPGELVTHRMSFDEVNDAYRMYEQRDDDVIKVVMAP